MGHLVIDHPGISQVISNQPLTKLGCDVRNAGTLDSYQPLSAAEATPILPGELDVVGAKHCLIWMSAVPFFLRPDQRFVEVALAVLLNPKDLDSAELIARGPQTH